MFFDNTSDTATNYISQENRVYQVGLHTRHCQQAFELANRYYSKVITLSNDSLLVFGGQTEAFTSTNFNISAKVTQLTFRDGHRWDSLSWKPMQEARVNFAALRLANGKVMVSGGFSHGHKGIRSCEVLDEAQQLSGIPDMTQARIAHSMC